MEFLDKRLEENVQGKYYVTHMRNGYGFWFSKTLQDFRYSSDVSYYHIIKLPVDQREETDYRATIFVCHQDRVKDDGKLC